MYTYDAQKEKIFKYKSIAEIRDPGSEVLGILSLGLSTYNRVGVEFAGYGNTADDAIEDAINRCKGHINSSHIHDYGKYNRYLCKTIATNEIYRSKSSLAVETPKRNFEKEYERYLKQCEFLGFKRNTEKMGECALKIKDTEIILAQSNAQISSSQAQQRTAESADTLNRVILLNESLKLLNPPRKNFNCQARPFGIYTNVYCN